MSAFEEADLATLVERARDPAGSLDRRHAAFAQLVARSQHMVFALALASLRDAHDAEDASQDAFATAWHRLPQLRDAGAFPAWLRSIVASECSRRWRRRALEPASASALSVEADTRRMDYQSLVASALERLPGGERDVTVLHYFLGYSLADVARLLRSKPGTVGKRLHSARLRMRRELPPGVRGDFVCLVPPRDFVERVSRGLLDEYVGEYRFERHPERVVRITRVGDSLVSDAGGQRHVLVCGGKQSFLTRHYDGEGRFHRDRRGEITHFVYYEFGRRLGTARRIDHGPTA